MNRCVNGQFRRRSIEQRPLQNGLMPLWQWVYETSPPINSMIKEIFRFPLSTWRGGVQSLRKSENIMRG
jgi:hypothetical protein